VEKTFTGKKAATNRTWRGCTSGKRVSERGYRFDSGLRRVTERVHLGVVPVCRTGSRGFESLRSDMNVGDISEAKALEPTKNNQSEGVKWAEKYEI